MTPATEITAKRDEHRLALHSFGFRENTMPSYFVWKRIINDYRVRVDAAGAEEALQKAYKNDHEPGELASDFSDGITFEPSKWIVASADGPEDAASQPIEFDRSKFQDLD